MNWNEMPWKVLQTSGNGATLQYARPFYAVCPAGFDPWHDASALTQVYELALEWFEDEAATA